MTPRERLLARIGDINDFDRPRPMVTLQEFFDSNDDPDGWPATDSIWIVTTAGLDVVRAWFPEHLAPVDDLCSLDPWLLLITDRAVRPAGHRPAVHGRASAVGGLALWQAKGASPRPGCHAISGRSRPTA